MWLLNTVNPGRKSQDKFYSWPICPREETSNNCMLLTSATINKSLALLNKLDGGEFGLDINTMKRCILVYGDALSCVTHGNLKLVITKKGTAPGNKQMVSDLLDAHSRIIMQKGLFHQLMHQSAVAYKKIPWWIHAGHAGGSCREESCWQSGEKIFKFTRNVC